MKKLCLIVVLLLSWLQAKAQDKEVGSAEIVGYVSATKKSEPLAFATVVLKKGAQIIEGVISDENGYYKLENIAKGGFELVISYNGFQEQTIEVTITKARQKLEVTRVVLQENTTQLEGVEVIAEKSEMSLRLDKKVFNVGKDILSQSGSVSDVLANVPSLSVDPSGVVSVRGNANITILINGRRSGLTTQNGLEQIPSDNVESVEVITNPSARYDASGGGGIVNIILKKNTDLGFSGQIRAVTGVPADYRLIGSLNYKTKKFNLFTNIGFRYTDYEGDYSTNQRSEQNGEEVFLRQIQDEHRHDDGQLFYIGGDYFFSDSSTLTAAFLRNSTQDTDETDFNYAYSAMGVADSTLLTLANSKEERSYNQLEMNYTKQLNDKGKKWTIDLQYDFWESSKKWDVSTQKVQPSGETRNLSSISDNENNDLVIQTDFVNPMKKGQQLEFGLKYENRAVGNVFTASEGVNGDLEVVEAYVNALDYDEQIVSAYTQYAKKANKISYMLGIRTEYTSINLADTKKTFAKKDDYMSFFPSMSFGYTLTEKASLQLNYSRRINRPSLWQLNPFPSLEDFNSQFMGNPELDPSFTHSLELGFLGKAKGLTINPAVYYSKTDDVIVFYTKRAISGLFITTYANIESEQRYGLEIVTSYKPTKWIGFNGEFNGYGYTQKGQIEDLDMDYSETTWEASLTTRIKPIPSLTFQGQYSYEADKESAQTSRKSVSYLNMGISKNLWNNKASIGFNVYNAFNTRKYRYITKGDTYYQDQTRSRNGARWSLNFVYKFNKKPGDKDRSANRSNRN